MLSDIERALIIRRDNIGDLLCTTPSLSALRHHLPVAQIAALVNDYNALVLTFNPDVDRVYSDTKAKHSDATCPFATWREWRLYRELQRGRFGLIIHTNPIPHRRTARLVRFLGGRWHVGMADPAMWGLW